MEEATSSQTMDAPEEEEEEEEAEEQKEEEEEEEEKKEEKPAEPEICSFCLQPLLGDSQILCRLPCGHEMHFMCARPVVAAASGCPLCRRDFGNPANDGRAGESIMRELLALGSNLARGSAPTAESECHRRAREKAQQNAGDLAFLANNPPLEPAGDFVVHVLSLTGKKTTIATSPNEYVGNVMLEITKRDGIPYDQLKLIWAGRQLDGKRTLADYGIHIETTIHLVLDLRGGKPVVCFSSPRDEFDLVFSVELTRPDSEFTSCWPSNYSLPPGSGRLLTWRVDRYDAAAGVLTAAASSRHAPVTAPYLFYEYSASGVRIDPASSSGFAGSCRELSLMLESIADAEGLDPKNRADFVTYCLPRMREEPGWSDDDDDDGDYPGDFRFFAFQVLRDGECDALAKLTVNVEVPRPYRFMLLWKRDATPGVDFRRWNVVGPAREGTWQAGASVDRCMLEWGSMQVY